MNQSPIEMMTARARELYPCVEFEARVLDRHEEVLFQIHIPGASFGVDTNLGCDRHVPFHDAVRWFAWPDIREKETNAPVSRHVLRNSASYFLQLKPTGCGYDSDRSVWEQREIFDIIVGDMVHKLGEFAFKTGRKEGVT